MRNHQYHADLLITDGRVHTPSGKQEMDIACKNGQIVAIGSLKNSWSADDVIQASGLDVLPGVMDTQLHFREPGLTHKETIEAGTRGAVLGGITSVFEMPNTHPLTVSKTDLQQKLDIAKRTAWCDHAFYIGGSNINANQLASLETLPGCSGIKVFMGSSFGDLLVDDETILKHILSTGNRRVAIHAEDEARLRSRKHLVESSQQVKDHPTWRDVESALIATKRVVTLAEQYNRKLHVLHISTAEEIAFLAEHKSHVNVEVTPQHLTLMAPDCYDTLGTLAQMNPPIREKRHQQALWEAINNGIVDVIGSDHAPHTLDEKAQPYPNSPSGMTGVQTLLPIMLDHVHKQRLSIERLIDLTSSGPVRLFNIRNKGRIAVGYDADFSIVDLKAKRTIRNEWIASVSGWTPYDGREVTGWPIHTIVRGDIKVRDEALSSFIANAQAIQFSL